MAFFTTQLVEMNSGYALGGLSEGLARKMSPVEQMFHVINRLLERSNPLVVNESQLMKSQNNTCLFRMHIP